VVGAIVGLLTLALAGCGSDESGGSSAGAGDCADVSGPIRIGNISPLSGSAAALGKLNDDAARIAIDMFNKQNDICGQKIENVAADDKGDPATAVNLGRKYVSDGISIMLNIGMSQTEDALAPYLMKEGTFVVGNSGKRSLLDTASNPSYFSIYPSGPQYARATAKQIAAQGWNNVGILSDGTVFGKEFTDALLDELKQLSIAVAASETYSPTAIDLTTPVQQVRSAGAEVLVPAGATAIPALVAAVKQSGWQPHMISWGAFITYATKSSDLPPGTLDGCQNWLPADQAPSGTAGLPPDTLAVLQEAEKQLGKGSFGVQHSQALYSQLLVVKAAVEKAGSTDAKKLREALVSLKDIPTAWPGVSVSFSADNHTGYPDSAFSFCQVDLGPYGIRYQAPNVK